MSIEEILRAGFSAVKSGDLDRAASYFALVVKADPSSAQGWYWLGQCVSASEQREYCFRRALALNPNHLEARQQLERLSGPAPKSSPAPASQRPAAEAASHQRPIAPTSPPVTPFVNANNAASAADRKLPAQGLPQASSAVETPATPRPQRKKTNKTLVLGLSLAATVIVCGLSVAYLFSSGRLAEWTSPAFAVFQSPVPLAIATPSPAAIPVIATSTSTPVPPTAIPSPKPTVSYVPRFEDVHCSFDIPQGADVTCGYLVVPEDRTGDTAHTIQLAVAIYHSSGRNPAPYPVIFLQGGPGGEAVQLSADAYDVLVNPFLPKRDFIAYDQRGTGLSKPALNCGELKRNYLQDIHGLIPVNTRKLVYSNAFVDCNILMAVQGVNLNAYTTAASAADVRDLLFVLGYQKADLYGASYGTRLAQVIMRDYPDIVHSAILDSVLPVETNLFREFPDGVEHALGTLFENCAASPECNAAYPQLEAVFWDLIRQLDAQPVTVTTSFPGTGTITENVNGTAFMSIILGSIKQSSLISTAPQSIYRVRNGDYSTLMAAQTSLPFTFEDISPGLYISMMCHEHILATTLEQLQTTDTTRQVVRDYAWLPFYGSAEDIFKTCQSWGTVGPWLGENDPVNSDIPALILAGTYDPVTPPGYGQQLAGHLSHGYYFEFPNQGHTPTATDSSGCAMDAVLAFLDDPGVEPEQACLGELEGIEFVVPYAGDPALSLKTVEAMGASVKVPESWYSSGLGGYYRLNSPLDIAQVGIFQAAIHSSDLEEWFSSIASGYMGLDAAPIQAGQRQANGLTWTLYTSSAEGWPVDIAMAGYRGQSLLLMMLCNSDEHDALYRTVFLPMVDSAQP